MIFDWSGGPNVPRSFGTVDLQPRGCQSRTASIPGVAKEHLGRHGLVSRGRRNGARTDDLLRTLRENIAGCLKTVLPNVEHDVLLRVVDPYCEMTGRADCRTGPDRKADGEFFADDSDTYSGGAARWHDAAALNQTGRGGERKFPVAHGFRDVLALVGIQRPTGIPVEVARDRRGTQGFEFPQVPELDDVDDSQRRSHEELQVRLALVRNDQSYQKG